MSREYSLGEDGEAAYKRLESSLRLGPESGRALVASDSVDVRYEVRRRVGAILPVKVVRPGDDVVKRIHEAVAEVGSPVLVWIEGEAGVGVESEAWRQAYAALNMGRDVLAEKGGVSLVLAGPRGIKEQVAARAPDLASVIRPMLELGVRLDRVEEAVVPLTWLHVSDLHIGAGGWQQDVVLDGLLRDVPRLLGERELKPDLVLVTGDVVDHGPDSKKIDAAYEFLSRLCDAVGVEPRERLFMVPGNHDVERGQIRPSIVNDQKVLLGKQGAEFAAQVALRLDDEEERRAYTKRLQTWCELTQRLLGPDRGFTPDQVWRSEVITIGGLRLGVASLCSVWMSGPGPDEYGKVVLGERQARRALALLEEGEAVLRLVLLHHPLEWLHEAERRKIQELLRESVDVALHGHVHEQDVMTASRGTASMLTLSCGAAYAGAPWHHGVQVGRLDPRARVLETHYFTWSERGFWAPDATVDKDAKNGRLVSSMTLPRLAVPEPSALGGSQDLDALSVRFRRRAVEKYRYHAFPRLSDGEPKPMAAISSIFVPLGFEEHDVFIGDGGDQRGLRSRGVAMDLATLLKNIDGEVAADRESVGWLESPSKHLLAVLGDPGSGKSMLCRWLAWTLAEREQGRVPVLVQVVDWMSSQGSGALLDAMVRALDSGLLGATTVEAVRSLCAAGRVVLLVDGLDEAVRQGASTRMREMLVEFSTEYPLVSILVTSRVEGYTEQAPLPIPFHTFVIAPFDEGKLEDFVRCWYEVVEPDDPEKRARGRAALTAALAAEPRAREMARNPLLATLIASVHHARRDPLPSRRSELYDLVVELLLETRPEDRDQLFTEIDQDEQRALLERFALWLQEQRSAKDGEDIVFSRDAFVREMTTAGLEHRAISRRQARRWLDWLVRESGILVDSGPGRYGFFHLSLAEYLAAQGLLARFSHDLEGLVRFIAEVSYEGRWRETILLLLGSRANDQSIASAGVRAVIEGPGGGGGGVEDRHRIQLFLGLLLEDLEITGQDRAYLLSHVIMSGDFEFVSDMLGRVVAHSRLHGKETEEWLMSRISEGGVWDAVRVAAVCPPSLRPEQGLSRRSDIAEVGPSFLDESPVDRGVWAQETLSEDVLLRWAVQASLDSVFPMAISRLAVPNPLARLWSVAVLSRSDLRSRLPKGNYFGTYVAIRWEYETVECVRGVMPVWLGERAAPVSRRPMMSWDSGAVRTTEGLDLQRLVIARVLRVADRSEEVRVLSFLYGAPWHPPITPHENAVLAPDVPQRLLKFLGVDDSLESLSWREERHLASVLPNFSSVQDEISVVSLMVEVHAALLMAPKNIDPYRIIRLRLDNLFIHDFFDGLADLALERGTEHDCLPLLLALGFSQYQTTWSWPHSRHWQQWFTSPPPADWLAAFFWHLCWAVGDVDRYTEHYAAAQACLGRADWPELAAELRAYTIRPMTVEEWQRGGDPTPQPPPAQ